MLQKISHTIFLYKIRLSSTVVLFWGSAFSDEALHWGISGISGVIYNRKLLKTIQCFQDNHYIRLLKHILTGTSRSCRSVFLPTIPRRFFASLQSRHPCWNIAMKNCMKCTYIFNLFFIGKIYLVVISASKTKLGNSNRRSCWRIFCWRRINAWHM